MGSHGHGDPPPSPSPSPPPPPPPPTRTRRPVCAKCTKPVKLCLCSRFSSPPLHNSISITVLQHSHEVKHPLNSTRVAKLGFDNISVTHISDVNLHARLQIHPLNPQLSGSEPARLPTSTVTDGQKERPQIAKSRENPKPGKGFFNLNRGGDEGEGGNGIVTKEMNKYKVTCSPTSLTVTLERTAKPNLNWVPKTTIGKSLITNGFRVNKLHTKKMSNSTQIYQILEYDIIVPPNSVLLFPNEKSLALDSVDFQVKNLIVLDGTWAKAQRMYHENPWLKLLPHIKLDSVKESLYSEVRHEPKSGCLSTIESIVFALKKFGEDAERLDLILGVFESMILDQRRCKEEKFSDLSQP
ncbi:DTW domain-containing protein 2 [Rhynchospora pubera]|uniref:tRNA-uridine aminocarboxypropyltransferase n=2 Tax=Rhynchospora pubera TaxID=906938 RepID=A0AAV8F9A0_9POAL|nr:DTW domain-containing protein 2 [Rhynchospora pubera]